MKISLIFFFILIGFQAISQKKIAFTNYSAKDGLCENFVNSVTQDSRGFIWVGTQGGFNRFDGIGFKKFFPTELLGNWQMTDKTTFFFEHKPNVILAKLGNQKLYTFNTISQELKLIPEIKNQNCGVIEKIDEDWYTISLEDNFLVVKNNFKQINKINVPLKKKGAFVGAKKLSSKSYLVYTTEEFFEYTFTTGTFRKIELKMEMDDAHSAAFSVLYSDDKTRTFYINNYFNGLYKLDANGYVLQHWQRHVTTYYVTGNPNKMIRIPGKEDLFWLSGDQGITQLNGSSFETENIFAEENNTNSFIGDYACNLFIDNRDALWVSSQNGISRQNKYPSWIETWDLKTNKDYPFMNVLHSTFGKTYASIYFGGVYEISRNSQFQQIGTNQLTGSWFLFQDGNRLVQGGDGTSVSYYNLSKKTVSKTDFLKPFFKNSTLVVLGYKSKCGDIWYSGNAGGGLVRVEAKSGKIQHFSSEKKSFTGSYFTSCAESKNGDLWLGSNKSILLLHWIKAENRFEEINFKKKFEKKGCYLSGINSLAFQNDNSLWIGFDGTGLVNYNVDSKEMHLLTKRQGLPDNFIFSLCLDGKNRLWIGTNKGLGCLSIEDGHIYNFTLQNGFPTESFESNCAIFNQKTNQITIASNEMLLRFNPDQIVASKKGNIQVFIDEFEVNNKNRHNGNSNEYVLRPNENNLQISFCALNYFGNNDVIYSYKLEGGDNKWQTVGNENRASLVNLRNGQYTFHLRAKLIGDANWTYLSKPLLFTIQTPWYKSGWFFLIILFASVVLLYIVIRSYFVREIEQQKAILERQKAVQNERDRIAYDMHDDLGSGLTKISYLSQMALEKENQTEELSKINQTSLELVENMSELIWAMKVENDSLQDLVTYLKLYAVEYLEFNSIDYAIEIPENFDEKAISGEARRNIFLLFKESLHNIVKHAKAQKVRITFELNPDFCMIIHDNGIGFDKADRSFDRGNGLRNIEKRVQKLKGRWEILTVGGTQLIFRFPFEGLL